MKYTPEQLKFILNFEGTHKERTKAFNATFGTDKSINALRKTRESYMTVNIDEKTLVDNEKAKLRATATNSSLSSINKALVKDMVNSEDFLEELKAILKETKITLHKPTTVKSKKKPGKRTLVGHISDTHIGVCIRKNEMGEVNEFNETIAARRFSYLFQQIGDYKPQYRNDTDLVLVINGDILAGVIHDQEWGVLPMASQMAQGMSILSQGISYVAQKFKSVRVVCTTGNHSRFMHKSNQGRQTSMKWDSFSTVLYVALKNIFQNYKNVQIEIPETPYAKFKIYNHDFFATHGDTVFNIGNVSKTINMKNWKDQINDIISGIGNINVALLGHAHKITWQTLDNGVEILVNGTLSGTDQFAQSIGIMHNHPAQQIFEVTPEHSVGDVRFVRLKNADQNKELDKIIKPLIGNF